MLKRIVGMSLIAVILCAVVWPSTAAPGNLRGDAKYVIKRTAVVLVGAIRAVKNGGKPLGLAKAVGHQKYAIRLFKRGMYLRAIYHSIRSRQMAVVILVRNKVALMKEAKLDDKEMKYKKNAPKDDAMDKTLETEGKGSVPADDASASSEQNNVNIAE